MNFLSAAHTDVGIKKTTNQDSMLLMEAEVDGEPLLFAAICDGMGGLAKGELASALLAQTFENWFENELADSLEGGININTLQAQWRQIIYDASVKITDYSARHGVNMGTTVVALLLYQNTYYIANLGDSRAYRLTNGLEQITKDHTVVQREIDGGLLTPEQAEQDPRRNILLQCVGVSDYVELDLFTGSAARDTVFLLCSDGFRHVITPGEILEQLAPARLYQEQDIGAALVYLTDLAKYRGEEDNISALAVRIY